MAALPYEVVRFGNSPGELGLEIAVGYAVVLTEAVYSTTASSNTSKNRKSEESGLGTRVRLATSVGGTIFGPILADRGVFS
jgi:hypothetical protein